MTTSRFSQLASDVTAILQHQLLVLTPSDDDHGERAELLKSCLEGLREQCLVAPPTDDVALTTAVLGLLVKSLMLANGPLEGLQRPLHEALARFTTPPWRGNGARRA